MLHIYIYDIFKWECEVPVIHILLVEVYYCTASLGNGCQYLCVLAHILPVPRAYSWLCSGISPSGAQGPFVVPG